MFGSIYRVFTVGGSNGVIYIGLYQIQDGGQPPSWKILNDSISAKGHAIHFMLRFYGGFSGHPLYSTHRAVIFAIAQLSCMLYCLYMGTGATCVFCVCVLFYIYIYIYISISSFCILWVASIVDLWVFWQPGSVILLVLNCRDCRIFDSNKCLLLLLLLLDLQFNLPLMR